LISGGYARRLGPRKIQEGSFPGDPFEFGPAEAADTVGDASLVGGAMAADAAARSSAEAAGLRSGARTPGVGATGLQAADIALTPNWSDRIFKSIDMLFGGIAARSLGGPRVVTAMGFGSAGGSKAMAQMDAYRMLGDILYMCSIQGR
jgi:hypothetical protein